MFKCNNFVAKRLIPAFVAHCDRYGVRNVLVSSSSLVRLTHENNQFSTFKYRDPVGVCRVIVPGTKVFEPCREYAARKGTRARKAAKKVKKVEVKQPFMFKHLRKLAE